VIFILLTYRSTCRRGSRFAFFVTLAILRKANLLFLCGTLCQTPLWKPQKCRSERRSCS